MAPRGVHPDLAGKGGEGDVPDGQLAGGTGGPAVKTFHPRAGSPDFHRDRGGRDSIYSVIIFDMEYPLDGSAPTPVEHDPSLDRRQQTRRTARPGRRPAWPGRPSAPQAGR